MAHRHAASSTECSPSQRPEPDNEHNAHTNTHPKTPSGRSFHLSFFQGEYRQRQEP